MDWPHAPAHWLFEPGIYMVTAGMYRKERLFHTPERLDLILESLFAVADEFGWALRAWAVMSNHYHSIASSPTDPTTLRKMLGKLHMTTAKQINAWDVQPGRKVWQQFWDSRITYETSYLARLRYVHENPVHHGIVEHAANYKWCSAAWFACTASSAFVKTVQGFKIDRISVRDDF
jgi:putative transposase